MKILQNSELGASLRCLDQGGQPWFVAKDVCDVLGLVNSRRAIEKLDDDEKGVTQSDTLGGVQKLNIVSESGLYALILRSDKPAAKMFRKWVTSEVLPAIRETGVYSGLNTQLAALKSRREELLSSLRSVNLELSQCRLAAARKIAAAMGVECEFDKITLPPVALLPKPKRRRRQACRVPMNKLAAAMPGPMTPGDFSAWLQKDYGLCASSARQRISRMHKLGLVTRSENWIYTSNQPTS